MAAAVPAPARVRSTANAAKGILLLDQNAPPMPCAPLRFGDADRCDTSMVAGMRLMTPHAREGEATRDHGSSRAMTERRYDHLEALLDLPKIARRLWIQMSAPGSRATPGSTTSRRAWPKPRRRCSTRSSRFRSPTLWSSRGITGRSSAPRSVRSPATAARGPSSAGANRTWPLYSATTIPRT
jgi:hypothetical protein